MGSHFPERIVCVDDDIDIRDIVRETFRQSGEDFVLVTCMSGEEIINRIRELQPDLILLDLMLGDMTGPDVIRALQLDLDFHVPIIFLTGQTRIVMNPDYERLGVLDVVYKPFDPDRLMDTVRAKWVRHQEMTAH